MPRSLVLVLVPAPAPPAEGKDGNPLTPSPRRLTLYSDSVGEQVKPRAPGRRGSCLVDLRWTGGRDGRSVRAWAGSGGPRPPTRESKVDGTLGPLFDLGPGPTGACGLGERGQPLSGEGPPHGAWPW